MKTKQSIECWLFHRGRQQFLLLQCPMTDRHPEYWQPITGGVFRQESLLDACIREVWEETGIRLHASEIFTVLDEFRVYVPEYHLEVRKPIFTAETTYESISISDEHLAYRWTSPQDMETFLFWESNKHSFASVKAFYQQCG